MVDIVDATTRRRMMAGIRAKNTAPEMIIRRGLYAAGFRYRLHSGQLAGRPDITLHRFRAAIFVHGCFWHGHRCRYFTWPATRSDFWRDKIMGNKDRDRRNRKALRATNWRIAVVWECAIRKHQKKPEIIIARLAKWIRSRDPTIEISS